MSTFDTNTNHRLSLENIAAAAKTIDPVFLNMPQFKSDGLSAKLGCELTLKLETANPIGSFKGRGASFFIQQAVASGRARSMVCASAGNFGQALAYTCRFPRSAAHRLCFRPRKSSQDRKDAEFRCHRAP